MSTVQNPILRGFNPDPSIIRVNEDYYIATSTFEWFPGVQIHHSKNLRDWKLITRPLDRKSQLDMRGVPDSCGVWAPCLTHHDGVFYLVYSNVKSFDGPWKDTPNFLVTADNIEGPWSEPVRLPAFGFDASLFHEDNGRKWFVCMLVDHRNNKFFGGVVLQEYDPLQQKCVGPVKHIFEGTELGLTEAPHIYQYGGYYYLITAEGGTEYGHAVSFARSKNIDGPYETHPSNPILTSSGKPELTIQKAGHADIVETPNGEFYIVFLCARPLTPLGRCTLGRETSIEKLVWPQGDWPRLENGTQFPRPEFPINLKTEDESPQYVSNCEFETKELPLDFQSLRIPIDSNWCSLTERPGCLRLIGRDSLSSTFDQSLLARRIDSFDVQATTSIEFSPNSFQQMAGTGLLLQHVSLALLEHHQ